MAFIQSLLIRIKLHLFAKRYVDDKNRIIEELNEKLHQSAQTVQEKNQQAEHSNLLVGELKQSVSELNEKIAAIQPLLSYAQCGEDKILNFIFDDLNIEKPSYLDVGANYPQQLSNTYVLYLKGCYGVCVEPDPDLCQNFKEERPRDICLNIGLGAENSEPMPFYVFGDTAKGLNTFSKQQADHVESLGVFKVQQILWMPLRDINEIIAENFETHPNFLSLDVEGLDYEILQKLDCVRYPIEVICVETIQYETRGFRSKIPGIIDLMLAKNYVIYADTHVNTIFIHRKLL